MERIWRGGEWGEGIRQFESGYSFRIERIITLFSFFPPFLLFFTLVIAEEIKPAFSSSSFLSLKGNALRKRPVSRRLSRGKICDRLTRRKQELIRRIRGKSFGRRSIRKEAINYTGQNSPQSFVKIPGKTVSHNSIRAAAESMLLPFRIYLL